MVERLYLAKPRGFCAGVVMAIEAVEEAAAAFKDEGELAVYHAIVHNDTVLKRLESGHGVHFVERLSELKGRKLADTVVFSAHGVSPAVREEATRMGLATIDATCPLVTKVHVEVARMLRQGYEVVMIGHRGHPEAEGTMGQAHAGMHLVETLEDVSRLRPASAKLASTSISVTPADRYRVQVKLIERGRVVAEEEVRYPE
jgi:4-hydroxy-3-methylbut-2-enyl diphosphate reductase